MRAYHVITTAYEIFFWAARAFAPERHALLYLLVKFSLALGLVHSLRRRFLVIHFYEVLLLPKLNYLCQKFRVYKYARFTTLVTILQT